MDDGVCRSGSALQARHILQCSPLHLCTGGNEGLRPGFGARKAKHFVPCCNQFFYDLGTDESGSTGDKNTHDDFSLVD